MRINYLVSGPLSEFGDTNSTVELFNEIQSQLSQYHSLNKIILVTTKPFKFDRRKLDSRIVYIELIDPGPDTRSNWRQNSRTEWNVSRMFFSTISGLRQCSQPWTLKTRIELLPSIESVSNHLKSIGEIILKLEESPDGSISFIQEGYFGPTQPYKGIILWIPDTWNIMSSTNLANLWEAAFEIWREFKSKGFWDSRTTLSVEQLLGKAYYQQHIKVDTYDFNSRYDFQLALYRANRYAEKYLFYPISYTNLHLKIGKFHHLYNSRQWSRKRNEMVTLLRFLTIRFHCKNRW